MGSFVYPLEEIRARCDLVEVVSAYVALKHLGDRLCRFDVASLVEDPAQEIGWDITLLRDAF